eukprot:UN01545
MYIKKLPLQKKNGSRGWHQLKDNNVIYVKHKVRICNLNKSKCGDFILKVHFKSKIELGGVILLS